MEAKSQESIHLNADSSSAMHLPVPQVHSFNLTELNH